MNIVDGRGNNTKKMGQKNRLRVKKWFEEHPGSTIKECCIGLKLTYITVKQHINAINSEV